jgi:hypothetical protein
VSIVHAWCPIVRASGISPAGVAVSLYTFLRHLDSVYLSVTRRNQSARPTRVIVGFATRRSHGVSNRHARVPRMRSS